MATTIDPALWAGMNFDQRLAHMLQSGWTVKSDGPSGVQLEGEKQMRTLDKICLGLGLLTVIFYGLGLIFIAVAMIDYWALTPKQTYFLKRA